LTASVIIMQAYHDAYLCNSTLEIYRPTANCIVRNRRKYRNNISYR